MSGLKEFRVCPVCGYGRGFHVYFREEENIKIGLICPGCGASYDPGWNADFHKIEVKRGETYPEK